MFPSIGRCVHCTGCTRLGAVYWQQCTTCTLYRENTFVLTIVYKMLTVHIVPSARHRSSVSSQIFGPPYEPGQGGHSPKLAQKKEQNRTERTWRTGLGIALDCDIHNHKCPNVDTPEGSWFGVGCAWVNDGTPVWSSNAKWSLVYSRSGSTRGLGRRVLLGLQGINT